ncbi:MAG: lipopolysaccharide biosynthesis protein [Salinivirgaceae bacterium]
MQLVANFSKSPIVKNLSILVSGTVLAQIIVIGFQLILRRLYSPEDFGAFAVYMSVLGIVATIASFRYEQAILLPESNQKAFSVLMLSLLLAIFTFLVFQLFVLFFHSWMGTQLKLETSYQFWLYFLPLSIFAFSLSQALNFFLIRVKLFGLSASNKGLRRIFEGGLQSVFGVFAKAFGLFAGDFLGQSVVVVRSLARLKLRKQYTFNKAEIAQVSRQYRDFPLKNGLPSLLNALSLMLPVLIINSKFSGEITGYFDLARMVLIIPLSLVTASLSQVLLQHFTEKRNAKKRIGSETLKTFLVLVTVALIFGLVIQFFGAPLFQWVFGVGWQASGQFASILVWAFALKFVVSPFNIVFTAFEKIGWLSIWQVVYFLLIIALNWLPVVSVEGFLKYYLVIELISYAVAGTMDFAIICKYDKSIKP